MSEVAQGEIFRLVLVLYSKLMLRKGCVCSVGCGTHLCTKCTTDASP
jgi:hypothetical protein